ncbi:MAG: hypothetical protein KGY70_09705, partial [Bacteroidales bacterium]|nr:hypothetical protein [Bacteroidales bacterium]
GILDHLKEGEDEISIRDIVIKMIAKVWYTVNYFYLSFGKWDRLAAAVGSIRSTLNCDIDIEEDQLIALVKEHMDHREIGNTVAKLARYVPYRFLSPWFASKIKGIDDRDKNRLLKELAEERFYSEFHFPPYRFSKDESTIIIQPEWREYFITHMKILQDFTLWQLLTFLRKRNPNVPNIQTKLFPPQKRDFKYAKRFWNLYFDDLGQVNCIYSGLPVTSENFNIDHFVPWSFVTHDQLWNLLPIPKGVNSAKSDRLPARKFLDDFGALQHDAFNRVLKKYSSQPKLLEDYSILFNKELDEIQQLSCSAFVGTIKDTVQPLLQIAGNMGFEEGWEY